MKFRLNYNLLNTAIEDLIKFIRLLLNEYNIPNHELFSKSLYKAKNYLSLIDRFITFAFIENIINYIKIRMWNITIRLLNVDI